MQKKGHLQMKNCQRPALSKDTEKRSVWAQGLPLQNKKEGGVRHGYNIIKQGGKGRGDTKNCGATDHRASRLQK